MKHQLAKGVVWLGAAKLIVNLLALLSTLVLARLLSPEDFGLVAIATTMLAIVAAMTELSLSSSLIHHPNPTEDHFNTAWTLNCCRALIVGSLFCFSAPILASIYSEPRLQAVIILLGIAMMLSGATNPKTVLLTRQLEFWQEFALTVTQKIAGFLVGVGIALMYQSYWALVAGTVASQVAGIIVSYIVFPFRPRPSFAHARELWSFSIWLTLGQIVNTLNWKLDHLLVGGYIGPKALGYYAVGDNLAGMPIRETIVPLEATLFPGFTQIAHDKKRLQSAYRSAQTFISLLGLPIGIGCALLAKPLVLLAMGEKWLPVVDIIQVLAPVFALQTLSSPVHALAMSKGETKLMFRRDLFSFAMRVPIILIGLFFGGLMGLIYARSITGTLAILINMTLIHRLIEINILDQIKANIRSLLSVTVMALGLILLQNQITYTSSPFSLMFWIATLSLTGAVLYAVTNSVLWWIAKKPIGPETEFIAIAHQLILKLKIQIKRIIQLRKIRCNDKK